MVYKAKLILVIYHFYRNFRFPRIVGKLIRQMLLFGCIIVIISLTMPLFTESVNTQQSAKKLIQYGWDAPTPHFFREHIKQMEQRPFDGVIVKLNVGQKVFNKKPYPDTAFTQDRKDLIATNSSKLTNNFVIIWSEIEEGWDWFNDADWTAAEKNIRNFVKTAKVGHFRGIAFDPEPYGYTPWNYKTQAQHNTKTFKEYQQQVRKRGAQFMSVLQEIQPTDLLTLGLLSWMKPLLAQTTNPTVLQQELVNQDYGLWPAFINGMLNATHSDSLIIDGNEGAYYFYRASWFDGMHDLIRKDAKALVDPVNRMKYDNHVRLGQAVYVDLTLNLFKKPTNNANDSWYGKRMPHFLSLDDRLKLLEYNTYHGLRTADKYVWIYDENMDWWQNRIPKGAENAIQRAKAKIQKGEALDFNIDFAIAKALYKCKVVNPEC